MLYQIYVHIHIRIYNIYSDYICEELALCTVTGVHGKREKYYIVLCVLKKSSYYMQISEI